MSDYLASLGALGFTFRVRRLADRLQESGRRLYEHLDVPLEPNWHALLLFVERNDTVSITQTAAALEVSHPAVIDMARRIEAAGFLETTTDPADGRRRVLRLSPEGRRRLPAFKRLWEAVGEEIDELVDANGRGGANATLATLETELDSEPLDRRVRRRLETRRPPSVRRRGHRFRPVVRPATAADREAVVDIARELVRSGDTYAYDPAISDAELWSYWRPQRHGDGYVAELGGAVVGAFVIRPNNPGPGAHVANASFAVRADVRGVGLGRAMGRAALGIAEELGYAGMQFNTVVTTNVHAVRLWRSLGFRIVGTVPDGFRLPDGTLVPHHIMYRRVP